MTHLNFEQAQRQELQPAVLGMHGVYRTRPGRSLLPRLFILCICAGDGFDTGEAVVDNLEVSKDRTPQAENSVWQLQRRTRKTGF